MFLLTCLDHSSAQSFSSMAVKMVWKVLRAKNGYDLLRNFRYIDSYLV